MTAYYRRISVKLERGKEQREEAIVDVYGLASAYMHAYMDTHQYLTQPGH